MRTRITRRAATRTVVVAAGALAAVAVAGCSGTATSAGTATTLPTGFSTAASAPAGTTSVAPAPTFTAAPNASPTAATAPAGTPTVVSTRSGSTPECASSNLKVSFGGGDAGMSQQERVLRFTNIGTRSCVIVGFPGVSYVAGDKGAQVGAPATRSGHVGAQVTLAPGHVASTVIHSVDVGVFDPSTCRPTAVRGYRIYPPDNTASLYIPLSTQGCAGTSQDPQLTVYTIKPGPGDPDQP